MSIEEQFQRFWGQRPFRMLGCFPLETWRKNRDTVLLERQQRRAENQQSFYRTYSIDTDDSCEGEPLEKAESLEIWAVNKSWTFCPNCKLLHRVNMQPSFARCTVPGLKTSCQCTEERYTIPRFFDIPFCLHQLTREDILALRPFDLHTGNYQRQRHGYRVKDGFCRVSSSTLSVQHKINNLEEPSRTRCLLAYRYLTTSQSSRYKYFVELR